MANVKYLQYLVTVDPETCRVIKLERLGEAGESTEIDISKIRFDFGEVSGTAIVVNIYGGVKLTEGDDLCISFPGRPPGRAR
jgi:hypothetical protein